MSEISSQVAPPMSKKELEENLNKAHIQLDSNQAAVLNKMLGGTSFRLDLFDDVVKKVTSSSKKKKKAEQAVKPTEFVNAGSINISEDGLRSPGSDSSMHNDDSNYKDGDLGLSRRMSRREKKPTTKVDLGYEEPKPIKGVKLSGSAKEIFRKCEEALVSLKDEFSKVPEFSAKAIRFEQEIKKLKDGHYKNTLLLGNSIRKFLNNLFTPSNPSPLINSKIGYFINKFEESFQGLDNKTLFEESKIEVVPGRKKSGAFGSKKKLSRQGSRPGAVDMNRKMTDEEKKQLSRNIRNLTAPQLKGIIKIVKDMIPEKDGMLEFDIDVLPSYKCRELEEYVRRVKGPSRKIGSTPSSSNPKNLNSRGQPGYPDFKGQGQPRSGTTFRPDGANKGMAGSMHQTGLVDLNGNPVGGNRELDESSYSESESSNSIGSPRDMTPDNLRRSQTHMPDAGAMNAMTGELEKTNSTGNLNRTSY